MEAGSLHCSGCARAPLVGERVALYVAPTPARRHGYRRDEAWLCELCARDPRLTAKLGAPVRRETVRSSAAANVRRAA